MDCTSPELVVNVTQPSVLGFDYINITTPSCYGRSDGSIVVGGKGGIRPYKYAFGIGADSTANTILGIAASDTYFIRYLLYMYLYLH